jgi:hypothetical protein
MVWISVFDSDRSFLGYVQLLGLLVTSPDDYRCMPHGTLSFESVLNMSKELHQGSISGQIEGYRWYRQAASEDGSVAASHE